MSHDTNYIVQITIVAVIVLAAIAWLVYKVRKMHKSKTPPSCCGCSLNGKCTSSSSQSQRNDCCGKKI